MNVLYVYSDEKFEWNCSEWRCTIPCEAINKSGLAKASMISMEDFATGKKTKEIIDADIVVLQRNLYGASIIEMLGWRFSGKPFILDLDDAYHLMPSSVISSVFWRVGMGKKDGKPFQLPFVPLQQLEIGARLVNAITVPSKVLLDDWKEYGPTYLVPNYPRIEPFVDAYEHIAQMGGINIGWGGSFSHLDSFLNSNMVPAIRRITEKYDGAEFIVTGGDNRLLQSSKIQGAKMLAWVPFNEWPKVLRSFTIGVAPLCGAYDQRRSYIKILDYMLMGIPWVATDDKPYQDFREYGTLVRNQSKAWEAAFEQIITNPDLDQIKRAREYALTFGIDQHVQEILDIYQKVIDERKPII